MDKNKHESNIWDFGDKFPSIEIDTEYWQTLNVKNKFDYLFKLIFQEKDLGNRMNMINYIMSTSATVGKAFVKNKEIREYFDLAENATKLINISTALGNIFKAKQRLRNTKNNAIAKLMGLPNGDYVDSSKLTITQAMAEAFIDISDQQKGKYGITIDTILTDDKNGSKGNEEESNTFVKNYQIVGTYQTDTKWGMTIKFTTGLLDEGDTTTTAICSLFYPISSMKISSDELVDLMETIMYDIYVDKVDTYKHYIEVNGTKLETRKRIHIKEEITNIPITKLSKAISKVLDTNSRRGMVFVGEPGVGKTIAVHKLINGFKDRLVFWVSPDSINSVHGIRTVFKLFKMFKNSIVVFDDLDSSPFTNKDEITNEFLKHLDGKNNKDLTGVYIATVNDPSKIHMAVINRPERFDDVIHVLTPSTHEEISSIIFSKCNERNYYELAHIEDMRTMDMVDEFGLIEFNKDDADFKEITAKIIEYKFTQVQIAGLISDCDIYTEDNNITIKLLKDAVNSRLESIKTANMVAIKGRLVLDTEHISEEASANLGKRR